MDVVDLKPRSGDPAVRELLALAVGYPTAEKMDRVIQGYTTNPDRRFVGFERNGNLDGCIGFEVVEAEHAVIHHIAVAAAARRQGVGRRMVEWLLTTQKVAKVSAETDRHAVGFYQRCGFRTTTFEHPIYGVERFRCELIVGSSTMMNRVVKAEVRCEPR